MYKPQAYLAHCRLVFSDLHVSTKTVDTCCRVLQCVREEAAARDAGIIFLGAYAAAFSGCLTTLHGLF